jgi:glycosyltransferase involved in cell wall biosynthesis
MRILYVATDQVVPGSTGGSVHVEEVARGLAALGHELHVVARPGTGALGDGVHVHAPRPLLPHRALRWTARPFLGRLLEQHGIEVVLERYYNFGGEGVRAAARAGIPSVLEVNSPVRDHPGSLKAALDRALLIRPMQKLREGQCRLAAALVTPLPAILPETVPRDKVFAIHWGANVERFRPGRAPEGDAARLKLPPGARVAVFSGSFRHWHGAEPLARTAARVLQHPKGREAFFLFLGAGPELKAVARTVEQLGIGERVHLAGTVPYAEMPHYLSLAHLGVAPFQPSRHGQLQLGFYWSPLKIFEYMASGLPVVTLDIDPLRDIVRHGREGLLVREGDGEGLAEAILRLVAGPDQAAEMGRAARERVVERYSWQAHCRQLEGVLARVVRR